ncbi:hypothetical protein [uncultured Demequina sp.]|uniref:hypothetical protein n=1 Tax=uncultured Demequina sp. TaxID=693499 RepID=UPI0025D168B2|nr:hypothetical protein [uncultured Demequina sp.]
MSSADYSRISSHLPAVYQEQESSFAQVDGYLELMDDGVRAAIGALDDAGLAHGPDAALRWPAGLPLDAGVDAALDALLHTYDEVAGWAAYAYPRTWTRDQAGLAKRRDFTGRFARLWRRRGTPRGFLDWFCLAFDIADADRPFLLEHFKVADTVIADPELTGTLFVRSTPQFEDFRRRREAIEFVEAHAPAHVLLRVCWTAPDWEAPAQPAPPPMPTLDTFGAMPEYSALPHYDAAVAAYEAALVAYEGELATHRSDLHALLCSITSFISHGLGITVCECPRDSATYPNPDTDPTNCHNLEAIDRLDIGSLPSED